MAIAPGAKNLRIACDGERILRAHNSVQTGISWLWVYADMHVYCVAHKTRWQISNFTLKKTKSFWSWCGRENICLIYHNLVIEISVEVTHGKILSNWHSKILVEYFWNFVPWILMMQSLNDPKKRRVLFSLHIYASQPKSWERVELDKFEFTLKFVRLRWVYFCPKSSKNRPFSAKIGHKMVFFMVLQMQHLLHPPPFKILTFCKSRRRVREFYCFLTAS